MALNTITKLRMPDGKEVAFVDWTDKPLYSTVEILSGATQQEMNLFQYTVGDSVPAFAPVAIAAQRTANDADTNIAAPGAMASTEEFLVYAIRPEICYRQVDDEQSPDFANPVGLGVQAHSPFPAFDDVAALNCQLLLALEISQKIYAQAGFGYFNWGAGASQNGGMGVPGDMVNSAAQNGVASQEAVRTLAIPQHIGGQEKFRVFLENAGGEGMALGWNAGAVAQPSAFVRIRVYLDGLYKRPVS